jgi:hypothetical protein
MNLDPTTYGKTPAAIYLVRVLNSIDNEKLARKAGKAISATNKLVSELVDAYDCDAISTTTLATSLRLIRKSIMDSENTTQVPLFGTTDCLTVCIHDAYCVVNDLTRNIQIGVVKRAMRLASIAKKGERVAANAHRRTKQVRDSNITRMPQNIQAREHTFSDDFGNVYVGGMSIKHTTDTEYGAAQPVKIYSDNIRDNTVEKLIERSTKRLARRGMEYSKD